MKSYLLSTIYPLTNPQSSTAYSYFFHFLLSLESNPFLLVLCFVHLTSIFLHVPLMFFSPFSDVFFVNGQLFHQSGSDLCKTQIGFLKPLLTSSAFLLPLPYFLSMRWDLGLGYYYSSFLFFPLSYYPTTTTTTMTTRIKDPNPRRNSHFLRLEHHQDSQIYQGFSGSDGGETLFSFSSFFLFFLKHFWRGPFTSLHSCGSLMLWES